MTSMTKQKRRQPDITYLLDHSSHVLRTQMATALAELGLTARMHCVLVHAVDEERTQAQLAEIGDIDKTTMVVTVDALEKAGLAERRQSTKDRRARIIAVTEKGEELLEQSEKIVDDVHRRVLGTLSEADGAALVNVLKQLVKGPLSTPDENTSARRPRQR
ncbi:MarR family winged helix-turn-helix transcriptional regulator [Streptomyces sp. NPDC004609]|uniref:MarR family winged helix-turn-helix transcriptional regulator n=1 Tax=Streptomyces sp. NPDC004609 TaxID=3364704 RepID=UPI00369DC69A